MLDEIAKDAIFQSGDGKLKILHGTTTPEEVGRVAKTEGILVDEGEQ